MHDSSIYRGILTGYNDAFIVDQQTRDTLITEDPASQEILKPILRGRDIARYRANWADLWLIDTHNGYSDVPPIDVDNYPAVRAHLDKFISQLERRQDQGVTPYNLRNCAYHEDLEREKVIWIELVKEGRFAFDESGTFIEATAFMLTGKETKPLCALLNSSVAQWYIGKNAPTSGMGTPRWKKAYVESIPLVKSKLELKTLGKLVDEAKLCNDDNKLLQIEENIDSVVFRAYGFTIAEVDVIKSMKRN